VFLAVNVNCKLYIHDTLMTPTNASTCKPTNLHHYTLMLLAHTIVTEHTKMKFKSKQYTIIHTENKPKISGIF